MIVTYVMADDDSSMKVNVHHYYTELMYKDPHFLCPRANIKNLKDVGKIALNIPDI